MRGFSFLFFCVLLKGGLGTSLDCNVTNTNFVKNGTNAFLTCTTTTSNVVWRVPPSYMSPNDLIVFSPGSHDPGNSAVVGGGVFTAVYINETHTESTLSFVLTPSLNGSDVRCGDGSLTGTDKTCLLLVISPPRSPVINTNDSQTYDSTFLQWSKPFNGGSNITGYRIEVSPEPNAGTNCPGGQCTTTELSYNVTGLTPNVQYTFTVRAENSEGIGEGASVTVTTVGNVFPPLTDPPQLCLNYTDSGLMLEISWNCSRSTDAVTPPIIDYTVCTNENCDTVEVIYNCTWSVPISCNNTVSVNVTLNNQVGSSEPSPLANIGTNFIGPVGHSDVTNDSVIITYSPFNGCSNFISNARITFILTNENTSSMVQMSTLNYSLASSISVFSLNESTPYSYEIQLTANICSANFSDRFTTIDFVSTVDVEVSSSSIMTVDPTFMMPSSSLVMPSSTDLPFPTDSPSPVFDGPLPTGAIIGIAVGGAFILLGIIIIVVVILVLCLKSRNGEKASFTRNSRVGSEEPIALVNRTEPAPETGQALYQDPDTIQREKAPTGDLYALPDKPKQLGGAPTNNTPAPHQPVEQATYQDPSTIQREQAPTGDMYAIPEKKQPQPVYSEVNKENKTGIIYAELGLDSTDGAAPGSNPNTVLYSDINVGQQHH